MLFQHQMLCSQHLAGKTRPSQARSRIPGPTQVCEEQKAWKLAYNDFCDEQTKKATVLRLPFLHLKAEGLKMVEVPGFVGRCRYNLFYIMDLWC
jgi:hypothetical protein